MKDISKKTRIWLKDVLAKEITSGDYSFNQLFPGIHQIARKYQVSYLTASRAMKLLENEGYLRCENGVGHFVNYISADTAVPHKKVNIITAHKLYSMRTKAFMDAIELFRSKGWIVNLLQCSSTNLSVISEINSPESYSIICEFDISWQRFQASLGSVAKRVLVLGNLAGNPEITSIISNEYETIQRAMAHFAKNGRKNVAILAQQPNQALEALRIGAWRSAVLASGHSYEWAAKHCFSVSESQDHNKDLFSNLCRWLENAACDTDAIIVPVHHSTLLAACMKCGIKVPDKIALMMIACSTPEFIEVGKDLLEGPIPEMYVLDHNYAGHFQCALEILEERFRSGKNAEGYWYFCPPGKIQKYREE